MGWLWKKALFLLMFVACARAATPSLNETLSGTYYYAVPGSTWTLLLRASGDYSITTQGGFERLVRPIESGHWQFEGFTLVLKSDKSAVGGADYRKLHVLQTIGGQVLLVSPLSNERGVGLLGLFHFVFKKSNGGPPREPEPNHTAEPASPSRGGSS
jgi:hypothetical protein